MADADPGAEAGALVLVVDDFEDAREMLVALLSCSGYRVAQASTGKEAIAQALSLEPALILMDLSLPDLDGVEATRQLKSEPRTSGIPIVALTGHAFGEPLKEARAAGCDSVMIKPCAPDALVEEIRRVIRVAD